MTEGSTLHIYTARRQPLTRYVDPILREMGARRFMFRTNPRSQVRCHDCKHLRYARNLRIQVYYDMSRIFCADGCRKRK